MNLSKHFTVAELSKTSVRNKDNTPSLRVIDNLQALVDNVLQPIRDKFGPVVVNSGYRSPEVNKAVGGSKTSDHTLGMAADIEVLGMDNKALAEWIRDNLSTTQIILEFYTKGVPDSGWVHVSYRADNLKNQTLTAKSVNGKTQYTPGIS
jgi:hypothetical protein